MDKIENLLYTLKKMYPEKNIYFGTFPSEVRPEYINSDILQKIHKYCHNKSINIGAQSGSNKLLKEISRAHSVDDIYNGIQNCFDNQIKPIVDFIFGFPTETIEDLTKTMELINWICNHGGEVRAHYFTPLPGTKYEYFTPKKIPFIIEKELGKLALNGKLKGKWN